MCMLPLLHTVFWITTHSTSSHQTSLDIDNFQNVPVCSSYVVRIILYSLVSQIVGFSLTAIVFLHNTRRNLFYALKGCTQWQLRQILMPSWQGCSKCFFLDKCP